MGSAKTRYIKRYYKDITVKRELWDELRRLADSEGLSIPELIDKMYRVYTARKGSRSIPVHKTMTGSGEVTYAITVDGETVTLTYRELRTLCRAGLVDITLCSKTVLA